MRTPDVGTSDKNVQPTFESASDLVPELFAVPVDWRMGFHFAIAIHASLAGESDFFLRVAEDLQAQQRIQPLPEHFENALLSDVLFAFGDDHIATAACSHAHAVHDLVRP